jgi:hypothetical protein
VADHHFGYRAKGRELVPDAEEQRKVARITGLRSEGLSLRAIGGTLEAEGLRNKVGGERWHPASLARVLRRGSRWGWRWPRSSRRRHTVVHAYGDEEVPGFS